VQLPESWEAAAQPALQREGDVLVGRFQGVPADMLAVTARHPAELTWGWIFVLAGMVIGLLAGVTLVRRLGRLAAGWGLGPAVLAGLAASLAGATALFVLPLLGIALWQALLDETQIASHYFYELNMAMFFLLGPAVGVIYVVIGLVLFLRARRQARLARSA
jgi:hypothetical protein